MFNKLVTQNTGLFERRVSQRVTISTIKRICNHQRTHRTRQTIEDSKGEKQQPTPQHKLQNINITNNMTKNSEQDAVEKNSERNSDIKNEFIAQIIKEAVNSIALEWNFVEEANVYRIEKHHKTKGWTKVDWTSNCSATIDNLEENFGYLLRVKALRLSPNASEYEVLQISNEIVGCTLATEPTSICLFRAIKKDHQFLVKRILRRRPTLIEYPGPNGYSPLANAIAFSDMCVVDVLLSAGASVHEGNPNNNRTPLHQAFFYGRVAVARMLLNKKANMEARDMYGLTPCHLAVDANQGEILKFALENGANVESKDASGWTLLMRAVVMDSDMAILKLLIIFGADLESRDMLNLTCQDLARLYNNKKGQDYFVKVLKSRELQCSKEQRDEK